MPDRELHPGGEQRRSPPSAARARLPRVALTRTITGTLAMTLSMTLAMVTALLACEADDDPLAREVPVSGASSPIFAEVDIAMRQLVKWRCVGAGVLAISYRGHRIYSRGFGKTRGSATPQEYRPGRLDRCRDAWDPDAPITPPETPMRIGSVTKGVVAAIVRPLVAERIAERSPGAYDDEFDAPLLYPALDLLPVSLRRYFHHPDACPDGIECLRPPVANPGDAPPPEVPALCEPEEGADRRWPAITIGHLLTHRAGLAHGNAQWPEVTPEHFAALRGYTSRADVDDAHQRSRAAFGAGPLDRVRGLTARALGVNPDAVYFVGHYDQRDPQPIDQQLRALAGRCLTDWPGKTQSYSNTGHALLGRVIDHLWSDATGDPRASFAGRLGHPEEHDRSALAAFVRDTLEIDGGVEARHAIYGHQWFFPREGLAKEPAEPDLRGWEDDTYTPSAAPPYHFYCVWSGDHCDASSWSVETLRWRWDLIQGSVPRWAAMHSDHYASGGLMAEASAMLELVNRFQIGRGAASGTARDGWANGSSHGGSLTGGRAFLGRHGGVQNTVELPPLDADGRITDDFANRVERKIRPEAGVAFFVGVNQSKDARCGAECGQAYDAIEDILRYTLTRVDWDDVRHMIEGRRRRVVGLLSTADDRPLAWFADGSVGLVDGDWSALLGDAEALGLGLGLGLGLDNAPRVGAYRLPSTRIGEDVLGMTLTADGTFIALFRDGRAGLGELVPAAEGEGEGEGEGEELPRFGELRPQRFGLPEGVDASMIVAIASDADGRLLTWLSDQDVLRGDLDDLGADGRERTSLPPERAAEELADATIAADGSVRALFDDGTIAIGSPEDLRTIAQDARVVGVATLGDGALVVAHANGYLRAVELPQAADEGGEARIGAILGNILGRGRIALETPPEPDSGQAPTVDEADVIAIATDSAGITHAWLRDGRGRSGRARLVDDEEQTLGLVDADLYLKEFTWTGDPEQIIDVAFLGEQLLVWQRDGLLVSASVEDLRGDAPRPYSLADGRTLGELVGVAIDGDGVAYARYTDGRWSRGSPEALAE